MTPEERAEIIHTQIGTEGFSVHSARDRCVRLIAAQIEEAVEEARLNESKKCHWHSMEAKAAAYEDAAKIAERHHGHEGIGHQENGFTECLIAEGIRARAAEVSGNSGELK